MHKILQCPQARYIPYNFIPHLGNYAKVRYVAMGVLGGFMASSRNIVLANDREHHLMQHIAEHGIWHYVGHVAHLGSFASSLLGGLLSTQSLGGGDVKEVYIPREISRPTMTKCYDSRVKLFVDCLVLPNGKQVLAPELPQFYEDLKQVVFKSK